MRKIVLLGLAVLFLALPGLSRAASGGPDAFGYTFKDSNEPGGPTYFWEDISATGTSFGLGDDQTTGFVPIGFTFQFYGLDYTQLIISSNGFLSFQNNGSYCCGGFTIPNVDGNENIIAALWDDLMGGGRYETRGTAPNRRFIVQFIGAPFCCSSGSNSFQYVLYEGSNNIQINYLNATYRGTRAEIGIEDPSGTIGLKYDLFEGTDAVLANLAILFTPDSCTSVLEASTIFARNNSFAGNMFDVTNISNVPAILTGEFEGNFESVDNQQAFSQTPGSRSAPIVQLIGGGAVQVWYRPGSFVGHETDPNGWTLLGTDPDVVPNGIDIPTPFDVGQGLTLQPGETIGMFVYAEYPTITTHYTNGANTYVDGALQIATGIGKGNSTEVPPVSGGTFTPRTWNGTISYELQGVNAFNVANASGLEGQPIPLAIVLSPCLGGFYPVPPTITINDVPTGAVLSAGINLGGGTWLLQMTDLGGLTITPPANSNADFTLTVLVDVVVGTTASTTQKGLEVTVLGVADPPNLSTGNSYSLEYFQGPLDISANLVDQDGSESLLDLTISGVPAGTTFNTGTDLGGGTWRFTPAQLNGLRISLLPAERMRVVHTLTVTATSQEDDGGTAQTVRTLKLIDLSMVLNDDDNDTPPANTVQTSGGCTIGTGVDLLLPLLLFGAVGFLMRRRES